MNSLINYEKLFEGCHKKTLATIIYFLFVNFSFKIWVKYASYIKR